MKILQLNATANWGSTGKIAEGIGIAAMKRGWESYIAYGRYENPSHSQLIKVGTQKDVYFHYARSRFLDGEGLGSIGPTKKLVKQIEDIKPDVIQLHNIHDHWLNYPILFNYLNEVDISIVWTFHDCWAFTGGCMHFIEQGCEDWKRSCKNCYFRNKYINRSYRNLVSKSELLGNLKNKLTIVSVSKWLDSKVRESLFKEFNHISLYNGIDTSVFAIRNQVEIQNISLKNKFVILGISSVWTNSKGLDDFIKLREILDSRFIIILIGLPKPIISKLPEGIIGIERTNNLDELVNWYNKADVVMSLSKAETFGMTLVEGQACGTSSIGYAATAINEVINDTTGIKVESGNINAVVDAVHYIANNNPFDPSKIRNYVLENFNAETQYNKYIDLYESIIR